MLCSNVILPIIFMIVNHYYALLEKVYSSNLFFSWLSNLVKLNTDLSKTFLKIGPSGLSCFKDMDIYHVKSCTSCESKGDFA